MLTKIQVIEKINANLGSNKQVTDRSIAETVDALFSTVTEETDLDAFSTIATNVCKTMGGQILNEVATKLAEAKAAEPKAKTAEELAAQKAIDDAKAKADAAIPEYMKEFMATQAAKLEELSSKLTGAEVAKTTEQRKSDILAELKKTFSPEFVDANANFFDFTKEDAATGFTKMCTDLGALQGIVPLAADSTPTQTTVADFAAQKAKLQADGKIPTATN